MTEKRIGQQEPTNSLVLSYEQTKGTEAIALYNSAMEAQPWQESLTYDILAVDSEGLYVHQTFGYSVPRRNGKGEILTILEAYGLVCGEKTLHTAHRTATSSSASVRLAELLKKLGYTEVQRIKKDEKYEKAFTYGKQFGLEKITLLETGGSVDFRTRTSKGGLGEGFDKLIIDEAQEYTTDQESTLQFLVSDSENPQTILCGTPPTAISSGTVFQKMRTACLSGDAPYATGWAEWSVDKMSDVNDVDLWYACNPAMGFHLTERKIRAEKKNDEIDYNIQRFGLWIRYNLKSAISKNEWELLTSKEIPKFKGGKFMAVKYSKDNVDVSLAIAMKTAEDKIFVEAIDCQSIQNGDEWLIDWIVGCSPQQIVIDGAGRQNILAEELMERNSNLDILLPKVSDVVNASALFEKVIRDESISHKNQPSLTQAVSNCEHRAIGSSGGFGYTAIQEGISVSLVDAVMLAHYSCATAKEKKKQRIGY